MADGSSSLLPVVVGGLLAMGGGVIAAAVTIIIKLLDWDEDRKRRRIEKFEQLVSAIYEHDHWLDRARAGVYADDVPDPGLSPLAKVEAIAAAYFPAVHDNLARLKETTQSYDVWMATARARRIQGNLGDVNEGFQEMVTPYVRAREALIDQLIQTEATKIHSNEISEKMAHWWRQGPGQAAENKQIGDGQTKT